MIKTFNTLVALLVAMYALTACGDGETQPDHQTYTAANGDEFNDADVDFATEMIQHHAQALKMVDLTLGRELEPEIQQLTEDVRAAQAPEIEQMVDWVTAWDRPIPETVRDHANAHGEGDKEMDADMPGMTPEEEMSRLQAARDAEFQQMWLEMMIEHHKGAIEKAKDEQADGVFQPAIDLAESIETSQQAEIDHMRELLAS